MHLAQRLTSSLGGVWGGSGELDEAGNMGSVGRSSCGAQGQHLAASSTLEVDEVTSPF